MLSIIIPSLNEEKYLPSTLFSIKEQSFSDYEIILADAGSTDRTLEIAKQYNCRVIEGGLPARGRNNGAKVAKGDILFFLDADAMLANGFLSKALAEFTKRKLDMAGFCLIPYPKTFLTSLYLNVFYNALAVICGGALPHAAMGILMKKDLFEKLGGFDESIKLAEDHDLARRAKKYGKFGIISAPPILFSDRRFKKEGWFTLGFKYFLGELHMVFIGPVKSDIFNYKFNHYDKEKK